MFYFLAIMLTLSPIRWVLGQIVDKNLEIHLQRTTSKNTVLERGGGLQAPNFELYSYYFMIQNTLT